MRRFARKALLERVVDAGTWSARLRVAGARALHVARRSFPGTRHPVSQFSVKPDQPDAPFRHARGTLVLLALCLALLAAGDATPRPSAPDARMDPQVTPAPTSTPWPTTTPTPPALAPLNAPAGWQVYSDHHFAVAYPPGWQAVEHVVQRDDGTILEASVSFNSDDGVYSIGVAEREGLDETALQQFCDTPGSRTTYAGLPMIASRTAATLRMYVFVSTGGVAYTLLYKPDETLPDIQYLYDAILSTFRPEVAISACG